MRIPKFYSSTWILWFCDVTITPCACNWACTSTLDSEVDIKRILEEVEQLALWCLIALISGLTCHSKEHWA